MLAALGGLFERSWRISIKREEKEFEGKPLQILENRSHELWKWRRDEENSCFEMHPQA